MENEIAVKDQNTQVASVLAPQPTLLDIRRDKETYPRLHAMDETEALVKLGVVVGMAAQYRGQQIDPRTSAQMALSLYQELMADPDNHGLRYLTIEEITRVVKRALTGQTQRELYGVNVASLLSVLTDYAKTEGAELQKKVEEEHVMFLRQGDIRYQQLTACAKVLAANLTRK